MELDKGIIPMNIDGASGHIASDLTQLRRGTGAAANLSNHNMGPQTTVSGLAWDTWHDFDDPADTLGYPEPGPQHVEILVEPPDLLLAGEAIIAAAAKAETRTGKVQICTKSAGAAATYEIVERNDTEPDVFVGAGQAS
jgi:hypothetical protein